jgi:hypothetical protein
LVGRHGGRFMIEDGRIEDIFVVEGCWEVW